MEREVILKFQNFAGFVTEYSADISMGGMFIKTHVPKPPGTVFHFEFKLADNTRLIQGLGKVVWVRREDQGPERPAGMGVTFLELDSESRQLIFRVTEEHIKRGGVPFDLGAHMRSDRASPPMEEPRLPSPPEPVRQEPPSGAEERPAPASRLVMGSQLKVEMPQKEDTAAVEEAPDLAPADRWAPPAAVEAPGPWGSRAAPKRGRMALVAALAVVALVAAAIYLFIGGGAVPTPLAPEGEEAAPAPGPPPLDQGGTPDTSSPQVVVEQPQSPAATDVGTPEEGAASDAEAPEVEKETLAEALPPSVPSAEEPTVLTAIEEITWRREGEDLVVDLHGDGPFASVSHSHLRLVEGSPRLLVRIKGVRRGYSASQIPVETPEVQQIRVGYHTKPDGNELHVVLDLGSPRVQLSEIIEERSHLLIRLSVA